MGAPHDTADAPLEDLLARKQSAREGGKRRGTYRVAAGQLLLLEAELQVGEAAIPVTLLDINAGGAGVLVAHAQGAALDAAAQALGPGSVKLTLWPDESKAPISLEAKAANVEQKPDGVRLGLRFEAEAARDAVDGDLLAMFNQRRALRVSPDPRRPIAVNVIRPGDAPVLEGEMVDVSVEGMAVRLPAEAAARLLPGAAVVLRFRLTGAKEAIRMAGLLRHVRPGEGGVACGFAFDPAAPDLDQNRTRIGALIVRRQLSMRRRGGR